MLVAFSRYSGLDMALTAEGDLPHHLIEDVAICVVAALADVVSTTAARYGDRTVPMDDALVQCVLDLGGRPYYRGPLPSALFDHWMRSFADNARATLHVRVLRGTDRHHVVEAGFKALGFAVHDALVDTGAVFSTKGGVIRRSRHRNRCSLGAWWFASTSRLGARSGYDIELTRAVVSAIDVPVVASGGAGSAQHVCDVFQVANADAALLAGILHDGVISVSDIKRALNEALLPVRTA